MPQLLRRFEGNNPSSNGTIRSEKWDFGAATYIGPTGPHAMDRLEFRLFQRWSPLLPGPGIYTVTLFTQNPAALTPSARKSK